MATKAQSEELNRKKPETRTMPTKNIGLRGVTVADTKISDVDGENGILIYRGYRIEELAENSTFEETAYLLLHDALPTEEQLKDFTQRLAKARQLPSFVLRHPQEHAARCPSHGCAPGIHPASGHGRSRTVRRSRGKPMIAKAVRLIAACCRHRGRLAADTA